MNDPEEMRDVFVDGLRNAHAMEKQALSIMRPQLDQLENYPLVAEMLDRHIRETETQVERLDEILAGLDESASGLKDTMLSAGGTMSAMMHAAADDEILKNSFANFAFENFEIAAYTSLITMSEANGNGSASAGLRQSLAEERRMADWLEQNLPAITEQYVARRSQAVRSGV